MKQKIKMIFDGTILSNDCNKNSNRSGIFWTAFNIFEQFIKNDTLDIVLYCNTSQYNDLLMFLKKRYPNRQFDIILDAPLSTNKDISNRLKQVKDYAKNKKNNISKCLIHFILNILSILYFFEKVCYKIKYLKYRKYDVFFSPVYKIPKAFCKIKTMKKYTILYDAVPKIYPSLTPASNPNSWWSVLARSLNYNDYYFTDSESARQDFLKFFPQIDSNKITTTLLASEQKFKPFRDKADIIKSKYNIPVNGKYIFSLCNLDPRKNLIRNVKTFIKFINDNNIDNLYYVLGGCAFTSFLKELTSALDGLGNYKEKIIQAGYIDDADLPALYSGAEWFVYTSQYEGFGLPPLEAMSCGCPVITSNNSSLPEVVGDAGIMIDWDSDEQHIQAYEKYYYDENFRSEMAKKGLERSRLFSWEKCANSMINKMMEI